MFFFFQSETQRRVREDIQKNMDVCLQNPKKYSQAVEVLAMHVNSSDQKSIEKIVDNIKATIKNQDLQPIRKYQAILLLKDLMKTQNKALGKYVVKKILKRLTILAQHKNGTKEEGDQQRGRDIFGEVSSSQQTYSINFLNTLLTALQQWGTNWSKAPDGPYKDFNRQYNQLVINGVKFPKKRPKQTSPSPQPRNNSISPIGNKATTNSSLQKKSSKDEVVKEKPKSNAPVKQIKKPLKPQIVAQLKTFYDKVKESMGLFNELLQSSTIQQFPLFRDIVGEIEKNSNQATQLSLKLENQSNAGKQRVKIQSYFTFLQKIEKDLNIVSKKPEKFEVFKTKYLKLAKSCLDLISQQIKSNQKVERNEQKASQISKQEQQITAKSSSLIKPKVAQKKDQPKIKNQNRYLSVTGINVLGPSPNQFGSGGQNGSVERFGSFGGINTDRNTERHRASVPVSSPRNQKQVNSDKKQQQSVPKEVQAFKPQPQRKQVVQNKRTVNQPLEKPKPVEKPKVIQKPKAAQKPIQKPKVQQPPKKQQKPEVKVEQKLNQSQDFFKQFAVDNKSNDLKMTNPFKDNDSFGAFGNPVAVQRDSSHDLDFFGKIDNSQNKPTNMQNINPRRKNVAKEAVEADIFDPKMKSQLSDGLSAFQKRQASQISGNRIQNKVFQEEGSKKSLNFDNPFGNVLPDLKKSDKRSQTNSVDKSKDQNPFSTNNLFQRSGVFQNDNDSITKKFQTGNFGKIALQQKKQQEAVPNPFETSSVKSKKNPFQSTGNPFQEDLFSKASKQSKGSKISQKSNNNPFQAESVKMNIPNPFQSNSQPPQNPFQTSTQKSQKSNKVIDDILEIFKPPTKKQIQDLSQRQSFKNIIKQNENNKKGPPTKPPSIGSQNPRQSIVFSVKLQKQPQPGLSFSQFQDIAASKGIDFTENKPNQHQQSGFSLSKFGDMNDPFQNANGLRNTQDFFAAFQNKSNKSKGSKSNHSSVKNINSQRPQNFFQPFNFNQQIPVNRKSTQNDKKSTNKNKPYEDQKTVKSVSEKSFDFSQLEKNSGIQKASEKKPQSVKPVQFEDFQGFGKINAQSNKELKQGVMIDIKSQKDLSWGDFDISANNMTQNQQNGQNDKKLDTNAFGSKLLEVQSKKDFGSNNMIDRSYDKESRNIKSSRQMSVNLQDFAPISKKGTEWNPLGMIPNLKPPQFTYMIDDKKLTHKKHQLEEVKKQYEQKLKHFKQAKLKNDEIRNRLMQKTNKVQEIIKQKGDFIQMLSKLKENNEIKEQRILNINQRIKKVEQIKTRILEKEKKLFDITKTQINQEDRKVNVQRSTASKWQLFNKSLEMHRNSSYSITAKLSNHGLSYF